jgi:hypothetical protein
MNDLTITDSSPTTSFFLDGKETTTQDFLDAVDATIETARQSKDIEPIGMELRSRNAFVKASVMSTAKLVYETNLLWQELGMGSLPEFLDWCRDYAQLSEGTIRNYILAWNGYLNTPEEHKPAMLSQPISNLQALGSKVSQGYVPEDSTWKLLAAEKNNSIFRHLLATDNALDIPRSNRTTIFLERSGDLVAWQNGKTVSVGYLNLGADDLLEKVINRIVDNSGIIRR